MSKQSPGADWPRWLTRAMADARIGSPAELARALRVDQSIVSRWLRGATRPSLETLRQLAPVLRKPLEELMVAAGHAQWHEFAGGRVPVSDELLRLLDDGELSAEEKLSAIRTELAGGTYPGRAG